VQILKFKQLHNQYTKLVPNLNSRPDQAFRLEKMSLIDEHVDKELQGNVLFVELMD